MKPIPITEKPAVFPTLKRFVFYSFSLSGLLAIQNVVSAQAVTEVITDYKGFWRSSSTSPNTVKPDNSHNLIAFSYNGVRYSTGANDALLSQRGIFAMTSDFRALPVRSFSSVVTSNTKVGVGAIYDGVQNGAPAISPINDIPTYLTDGIKGLNLGTGIANLPAASLSFQLQNLQANSIGDGIPDILVTQIADPSGSTDQYEFIDNTGNRVGSKMNITFNNINPVGTWTADFYEANTNPMILTNGFKQTDRPLRLWAADLSEFGITAANLSRIQGFKINLSGNSDVAFVAYNYQTFQVLPVKLVDFNAVLSGNAVKLDWSIENASATTSYRLERSADGNNFHRIHEQLSYNQQRGSFQFVDKTPVAGKNYYRLAVIGADGSAFYSPLRSVTFDDGLQLNVYPNPAKNTLNIQVAHTMNRQQLQVLNAGGIKVMVLDLPAGTTNIRLGVSHLKSGVYYLKSDDKLVTVLVNR